MSLISKNFSLFPISVDNNLYVYIRGVKIRTVESLTFSNYEEKILENAIGIRMFKRYQPTVLSAQELNLAVAILVDQVNEGILDKEYLTDLEKQAKYISKTFECVCSTSQLKRFRKKYSKNFIKSRFKRIKHFKKNESY